MDNFWDRSWAEIDTGRLKDYISHFHLEPDGIIRYLQEEKVKFVCDAGCGCGIYSLKLAAFGFSVSGFDVSDGAVRIAKNLLENSSMKVELKTASVLATGYPDHQFDGVVSRDVIDHMMKKDGMVAVRELYRILRPGGVLVITLDHLDKEYETEPHIINSDGDFLFTEGKWEGMVFHPYREEDISGLIPSEAVFQVEYGDEILLKVRKPA